MEKALAIIVVLNLAVLGVLIYRHRMLSRAQQIQHVLSEKALQLFTKASLAASLAEHEFSHEVCSECSKIVTRYEKAAETGKVTCIACMEKLAKEA